MYSLLIKNATVYDGTGKPGSRLDVAVQGDQIVNVAPNIPVQAQSVIDAEGKILTPGFVDIQNHSDSYWQLFDNPGLHSLVTQGFTTVLIGNCGASLAPLLSRDALLSIQKWHSLEGININWQSFSEYIEELSRRRFACNVASLVGYSTLRRGLVGDQVRGLEKPEMEALKRVLKESMDAGAFGLSSGLSYAHEIIISELELFELAKLVAREKGLFSVHLRNEDGEILEALEEVLDIAKNAEVNIKISHLKIRGKQDWHKLGTMLSMLEEAYHKGTNVHFDVYPYDTIWQVLYSYLPKWAVEGGRTMMLKHFEDSVQKNKILVYLNNSPVDFPKLMVASTASRLNLVGKTVAQVAKNLEVSSEQAVLHLIQNGGSEVLVFENNLSQEQVWQLAMHPLGLIGTDGGGFSIEHEGKLVHPRCFGTAPKFLRHVSDTKTIDMAEAIKKLTSEPAAKAGFIRRGQIKIGNFADLVVFDPATIRDKSTYENPYQYSTGINYVFVNGKAVVQDGALTEQLPGYVLRKK